MKKVSNNKIFVRTNLARCKSRNTNSIPRSLWYTICIITRYINITHLWANTSRKNKTIQWLIPMTTLVATVSNDFVRWLPGVHAPSDTNANNRTRDRRLGVVWFLTAAVEEKCFYWHNPSHSTWLWRTSLFLASTASALHRNAHIWNTSHPLPLFTYYCWVNVYSPGMEAH